jgi:phosphoribosylformimino-5-aminoimidazole carboxamide ribotide isomerase
VIFLPAIDLKEGRCVRLQRGDMATATIFREDPAAQAADFSAAGCSWLHVVDLDGAFAGRPMNADAVRSILATTGVPLQLGGGIRSLEMIDDWLGVGVARVILGTLALRAPQAVREACRRHPGRIAVGIDARDGRVAVEGWSEQSEITATDLARRFENSGVAALILTDITRDGVLSGPDIAGTLALADAVSIPVILSGGISSMADLAQLKREAAGRIGGVIAGRAIYDGRIDVAAAVRLLEGCDPHDGPGSGTEAPC